MREVTVNVAELVATMRANRETHRTKFLEALEGWQQAVVRDLEKAVEAAKAGREYRTTFYLPRPGDHTDDYDDVLGMLEMHTKDTVELTTQEYQRYVTDDWDWKDGFTRTYESYAVTP